MPLQRDAEEAPAAAIGRATIGRPKCACARTVGTVVRVPVTRVHVHVDWGPPDRLY